VTSRPDPHPGRDTPVGRGRARLATAVLAILGVAGPLSALVWSSLDGEDRMETVTWAGVVSSTGGSPTRLTLTLFPDSTYRLHRTPLGARHGQAPEAYELGRWRLDGDRFVLRSGSKQTRELHLVDANTPTRPSPTSASRAGASP